MTENKYTEETDTLVILKILFLIRVDPNVENEE